MREIVISKNEAGQRLNKLVMKYLNKAPSSFVYRMIRKKNIKLNLVTEYHLAGAAYWTKGMEKDSIWKVVSETLGI